MNPKPRPVGNNRTTAAQFADVQTGASVNAPSSKYTQLKNSVSALNQARMAAEERQSELKRFEPVRFEKKLLQLQRVVGLLDIALNDPQASTTMALREVVNQKFMPLMCEAKNAKDFNDLFNAICDECHMKPPTDPKDIRKLENVGVDAWKKTIFDGIISRILQNAKERLPESDWDAALLYAASKVDSKNQKFDVGYMAKYMEEGLKFVKELDDAGNKDAAKSALEIIFGLVGVDQLSFIENPEHTKLLQHLCKNIGMKSQFTNEQFFALQEPLRGVLNNARYLLDLK